MKTGILFLFFTWFIMLSCTEKSNHQEKDRFQEKGHEAEKDVEKGLQWHFEDDFTSSEKERLKSWIQKVYQATEKTLGKYPFTTHIYFHDAGTSSEPVPWAHTKRYPSQQVHFHVDLNFTEEDFLNDWTAPHEMSHLSIPFLGKENAWFAEGFASFWQYQIMHTLGVLSEAEMEKEYLRQWKKNLHHNSGSIPYVSIVKNQRKYHNYPAMYWGGAYFFFTYHKELKQNDKSFHDVMKAYLSCCRFTVKDYTSIVQKWDQLSKLDIGTRLMEDFEHKSGNYILEAYPY